jgi:hypothetical protein
LVYPTIGALVVSRRPKNAVGWVLCGMGFVFEVLAFCRAYADYSLFAHPGSLTGKMIDDGATPWAVGPIVLLGVVLLVVLFPDGRLAASYFRGVVWMAVGGTALVSLWGFRWSEETALDRFVMMIGLFGLTVVFISSVASVFAILERLQSADARERQQIKWFGYGAAVVLSAIFFLLYTDGGYQVNEWLVFVVTVAALLAIPVTVGVAILRYRLYDIDVVINRTLVYAVLTVLLASVYFGGVTLLQGVFRALTGQGSTLAVVTSTLVLAALFHPLRRRIQTLIDRRFYRRKYDAAKTLEAFSSKLRDETDLQALNDDLVGVVTETMQSPPTSRSGCGQIPLRSVRWEHHATK